MAPNDRIDDRLGPITSTETTVAKAANTTLKKELRDEVLVCYYHRYTVSFFTGNDSYGGIPALILFNGLLVLMVLLLFFCLWHHLEKLLQPEGLRAWRKISPSSFGFHTTAASGRSRSSSESRKVPTFGKSWLFLRQGDLVRIYGVESLSYLHFQRHIIALLLVISFCSVVILLPINVLQGKRTEFDNYDATTFANLDEKSNLLLIHTAVAFLFMPLSMFVMKSYVDNVIAQNSEHYTYNSQTLMLSRIPRHMRSSEVLLKWLKHRYPMYSHPTAEVFLTYDTQKLQDIVRSKEYYEWVAKTCSVDTVYYSCRGFACCSNCCRRGQARVAKDVYEKKVRKYERKILREKRRSKKPLDLAFIKVPGLNPEIVAFENVELTATKHFKVRLAPAVDDIVWKNITTIFSVRYRQTLFIGVSLVMGIFFTTPDILIRYAHIVYEAVKQEPLNLPVEFRVFLVFSLARGIQQLFCVSIRKIGYYRQSIMNREMLRATSTYLITILLILPFLGLLSVNLAVQVFLHPTPRERLTESMGCIFNSQGALTFVHYLLSAATYGNSIELLRPCDFLHFLYRACFSHSDAEVASWVKREKLLVWFGDYYSYDMLNLYISVSLCTAAPLVAPFGLFYFVARHFVSTYTLKQAWIGTKTDLGFHRSITSFVVGSALMAQLFNMFLICLRVPGGSQAAFAAAFSAILSCSIYAMEVSSYWRWPIPVWPRDVDKLKPRVTSSQAVYFPPYAEYLFRKSSTTAGRNED